MKNVRELILPSIGGGDKGFLSFVEGTSVLLGFSIKRAYWIYDLGNGLRKGTRRGGHAHRRIWQAFFCLAGSLQNTMEDETGEMMNRRLSWPANGLLIGPMVWHTMEALENGTVILVLASDHHDEAEYIRDRKEFGALARSARIAPLAGAVAPAGAA